jgi:hypothetical protein
MDNPDFRFLTTDEFNRMTQSEKMDYLIHAVGVLNDRMGGGWQRMFSEMESRPVVEH